MADEQPTPRPRRNPADLSKLFDSFSQPKPAPPPASQEPATMPPPQPANNPETETAAPLEIPPDLQNYLPPDLWRKLTGEAPRTGILVNAFERLNSLLYTLATYIPGDLVQEKLKNPIPGLVSGKMLRGCLLFSDVSGFTALSERLATISEMNKTGPSGAELLTNTINRYFSAMIDIVSWSNGTLLKFAGDAMLIYFPEQANNEHIEWATRAGLRMMRAMNQFADIPTPLGPVTLSMKVGMAAGSFLAASIGSPRRMEYELLGQAITQTMQAEGASVAGQLVGNELAASTLRNTYDLSDAAKPGFYVVQPRAESNALDDFEIRPDKRRGRRALPWDASPQQIIKEIEGVLQQVQSLTPYLASELIDRIVAHSYQRQVQSEFRPTVVMFCNFIGPEKLLDLWGEVGVQRVTGLLSAYFSDMNEAITRFGGIVSRIDPYSQGTKLLALFGAPIAHEDDAQRAINAALAMNSALQALNRRWAQKLARHLPEGYGEILIEHRIGITQGETFAGQAGASTRREYTVMGDDVNLAARLMSTAVPGQILISERVLERVTNDYITRQLPAVRVKGKKKPIPISQVDGPREDTLVKRLVERSPLIGRVEEFSIGWHVVQRRRTSMLTIIGPAGIGKSHLADALLIKAQAEGWQVHGYATRSYDLNQPYASWVGLLRSMAGITTFDHQLIQKEKFDRFMQSLEIQPAQASSLTDLIGLRLADLGDNTDESASSDDLFDAFKQGRATRRASKLDFLSQLDGVRPTSSGTTTTTLTRETLQRQLALASVLTALNKNAPLAIFFEDSHFMDTASRDTLNSIYQQMANQQVLFILSGRQPRAEVRSGDVIEMDPFTMEETGQMVASILTAGLVGTIHEQSSGSPLFVQEISRWIKRSYSISTNDLQNILQSSDILQKLVLSRLESLPESQREVARMASVLGIEFRHSEVEALMDNGMDAVTFSNYLQNLAQANLIALTEAGVDARYRFVQPVFRDVLYSSLPFERRRELHTRIAEYIQKLPNNRRQIRDKIAAFLDATHQGRQAADIERLAYHYEMSGQWLAAAQQLQEITNQLPANSPEAEPHYSHIISLLDHYPADTATPEINAQKVRAHLGLADMAFLRTDLPVSAASTETAATLSNDLSDANLMLQLVARLALYLPAQNKAAQAEKQFNRLTEKIPNLGGWKLPLLRAWLANRTGKPANEWIAACQAALPSIQKPEILRANLALNNLSANWTVALETSQKIGEQNQAALLQIRLGDLALQQRDFSIAKTNYQEACETWKTQETACGVSLAYYRLAELDWKTAHNARSTISLLEEALNWLEISPLNMQNQPRAYIQKALALIRNRQEKAWEPWQWQPFEDQLHIRLLLPLFA